MTTSHDAHDHTDPDTTGAPPTAPQPPGDRRAARQPIRAARRLIHVRRAFGEPIERDGVTLVPVARVAGGSGFGSGDGQWEEAGGTKAGGGAGSGGGFGVGVYPVGVYVVRGGDVRWEPAFDLNRAVIGGQLLGALALVIIARALRRRRR